MHTPCQSLSTIPNSHLNDLVEPLGDMDHSCLWILVSDGSTPPHFRVSSIRKIFTVDRSTDSDSILSPKKIWPRHYAAAMIFDRSSGLVDELYRELHVARIF